MYNSHNKQTESQWLVSSGRVAGEKRVNRRDKRKKLQAVPVTLKLVSRLLTAIAMIRWIIPRAYRARGRIPFLQYQEWNNRIMSGCATGRSCIVGVPSISVQLRNGTRDNWLKLLSRTTRKLSPRKAKQFLQTIVVSRSFGHNQD